MIEKQNDRTINDSIRDMIVDELKQQPYPTKATITRTYNGENRVDIQTDNYGKLHYIQSIIDHQVGDETILIFLDCNYESKIVI